MISLKNQSLSGAQSAARMIGRFAQVVENNIRLFFCARRPIAYGVIPFAFLAFPGQKAKP
jgi:hypothetical protein